MADDIRDVVQLGFPWQTEDPFLFCVHHDDAYPAGNDRLGPAASLAGRNLGEDFVVKDGWRMYHGEVVPGFPQHPHRGFETITVVRRGLVDHSDSLGAIARYGRGDVQWLTAGTGIVHAEMFPLLDPAKPNPLELFQIWLNLPKKDKHAEPHFTMFWADQIPVHVETDKAGKKTEITVVAGKIGEAKPLAPPPRSWASQKDSDVAVWTIRMDAGAKWTMPAPPAGVNRRVYFFAGGPLTIAGRKLSPGVGIGVEPGAALALENGAEKAELLVLQGRPIGEPVVQYGPFVMNTKDEIRQAFEDYQRTRFGGWPWKQDDPVQPRAMGRFARRPDGKEEKPKT